MGGRVIFLGLDGFEPSVLRDGAATGRFPAISSLLERSAVEIGPAPKGLGNDATWSVFNSGMNPGHTGRYFVRQVLPGDYTATYLTADHVNGTPYWKWLSDAGRRVAVVDAAYAKVEPLNGVQTADWLVHGPLYNHDVHTFPKELARRLETDFGPDPVRHSDAPGLRTASELTALADGLVAKTRIKGRYAQELLADRSWDHVSVTFTDGHCAGHQFWHLHDPEYINFDPSIASRTGDLLVGLYEETDHQVGELLALTDDDDHIVMFTGPGMGPNYTASHILEDVLRVLDPESSRRNVMGRVRAGYRTVVPAAARKKLRRRADFVDEITQKNSRRRRPFYAVPSNELAGAIKANIAGRDPDGVLHPGREYDDAVEQLTEDLHALRNLDTGTPIVREVVRADDLYSGPFMNWLPDILVTWTQDAYVRGVTSPKTGDIVQIYPGSRTGDHTHNALGAIAGPGISPGVSDHLHTDSYAPTMAALLGVDIPGYVEGLARV